MTLSDKIIKQRKKNGWSQEELAEKMNVSRQAVSKWEGAQAIPDIEKILQLASLFGVTTDYLLKEEIGDSEEHGKEAVSDGAKVPSEGVKKISPHTAIEFIEQRKKAALRIAIATYLCILSTFPLLLLSTASEMKILNISENFAAGTGIVSLLAIIAVAVAIFVYCGMKNAPFEFINTEPFELEDGACDLVKKQQDGFRRSYIRLNVSGTCICVLSPIPLLIAAFTEKEFLTVAMTTVTMAAAGIGAMLFIIAGVRMASMRKLLREGDYTEKSKKKNKLIDTISPIYWATLVAVYFIWSFLGNAWHISWLVFVIGGVFFPCLCKICEAISDRRMKNM